MKNNMKVNCCSETLRQPTSAAEQVCLYKEFTLQATLNHSGTLQSGNYQTYIKDEDNSGWLKCNDLSVIATPFNDLSSTSSYVLFYVAT